MSEGSGIYYEIFSEALGNAKRLMIYVQYSPTAKAKLNSSINALDEGFQKPCKNGLLCSLYGLLENDDSIIKCRITSQSHGLKKVLLMYFAKAPTRPC